MEGTDAGTDSGGSSFVFKPAPDGTFAQAVSAGGSVIKNPKLVPIIFSNDPSKQTIIDFTTKLGKSTYWGSIASEYGVGALTSGTPIIVNDAAPPSIDDEQISQWLVNKFATSSATFGTPDASTLYAIYYPPGTKVTQGGGQGCDSFGGYHFEANVGSKTVGYAVIPRCASFANMAGPDVITFASSHEVLEWATDPFPASRPAFMTTDDDHAVWSRVFLGELGDLCTQMGNVAMTPTDLGFTVQRTWSNASAKAGHHPCAPTGKTPYFTAFPAKLDSIEVQDPFGRDITTQGLKIPVGSKKTIDLTMYSDAAITAWTVQVIDMTEITGQGSQEFSFALDKGKGVSGDTLHLTVTAQKAANQGQGFIIVSQHGSDMNLWPVWVTN
jgi:hypothetical protein